MKNKIRERYVKAGYDNNVFDSHWEEYQMCPTFKINENVASVGGISEEAHFIMRQVAQHHLEEAFRAMKIDLSDENVTGTKGTPYRIIKMWTGNGLDDSTELLSGRWSNKPRLASFPNEHLKKIPITKRIDLTAVCSHHMAPFSTKFREDAYAVVSYIPGERVLGISKLQRIVDWVSRRGWLQEDLTMAIYKEISEAVL